MYSPVRYGTPGVGTRINPGCARIGVEYAWFVLRGNTAIEVVERVGTNPQRCKDFRRSVARGHEPKADSARGGPDRVEDSGRKAIGVVHREPVGARGAEPFHLGTALFDGPRPLKGSEVLFECAAQPRTAHLHSRNGLARIGRQRLQPDGLVECREVQPPRGHARSQELSRGDRVGIRARLVDDRKPAGNREVQMRIHEAGEERLASAIQDADGTLVDRAGRDDRDDAAVAKQHVPVGLRAGCGPHGRAPNQERRSITSLRGRISRQRPQQRYDNRRGRQWRPDCNSTPRHTAHQTHQKALLAGPFVWYQPARVRVRMPPCFEF